MYKVAVVTQDLVGGGGCLSMALFLYRFLRASDHYQPDLISLALSASDMASVRLNRFSSWRGGAKIVKLKHGEITYSHVGAIGSELESQRYQPRPVLTQLLNQYDLVQYVVGVPSLAYTALRVNRPVLVWTATTVWPDRASRVQQASLARRLWMLYMTRLAQRYEDFALKKANFIFALSNYTLTAVRQIVDEEHSTLAPYGIDTDLFCPNDKPDGKYILSVARFSDARKNVLLLLQAYAHLKQMHKEIPPLYLVGEPPTPLVQEKMVQLGIAEDVHLIGIKQGRELAEYYRNAMFFVLPSDEEGLGIVVLEAMASGLPVISTKCGGPETAIVDGETGLLTPVGNVESMAAAIARLLNEPALRQKLSQAGFEIIQQRFSLAAAGKIFLDKYADIMSQC